VRICAAHRLSTVSASWQSWISGPHPGIVLNEHYEGDGEIVFEHACKLGCEGIVSKRLGSLYRSGRSPYWVKVKNPKAPAVTREAEEDWGR
jgi:bifunctional non-homologous end joining protein LigD